MGEEAVVEVFQPAVAPMLLLWLPNRLKIDSFERMGQCFYRTSNGITVLKSFNEGHLV